MYELTSAIAGTRGWQSVEFQSQSYVPNPNPMYELVQVLEGGKNPGEAHCCMGHSLPHPPHHGMDWHHAKVGMFVHKGNCARGEKPQGERNDQTHHQDHHAVKPSKTVLPESSKSKDSSGAVDDRTETLSHSHTFTLSLSHISFLEV